MHRLDLFKDTKQRNKNTIHVIKMNQFVYTRILRSFIEFDINCLKTTDCSRAQHDYTIGKRLYCLW